MVSAAPKAQHEPQADWSLTSLKDSQSGQAVLESKLAGAELTIDNGWVTFMPGLVGLDLCSSDGIMKLIMDSLVWFSHLRFLPAFHVVFMELTWSAISWRRSA
jgi:hypothetical protein